MRLPEIEAQVRDFVWNSFLADSGTESFTNSDDLFELLDSLQVLRLVVQLEGLFDVKIADDELAQENLGSVEKAAAFVARKREVYVTANGSPST